jgi:hypothetical protein
MHDRKLFVWNGTNYRRFFLFWGRLEKRLLEKALPVVYFIEK